MSVIIFTSCVQPNTQVEVWSSSVRKYEMLDNIEAFRKSECDLKFEQVILADCSTDPKMSEDFFQLVRERCGNEKFIFHHVSFSELQLRLISEKGKGLSELLMLSRVVDVFQLEDKSIVKISGRYRPKSWKSFLNDLKIDQNNRRLHISFSQIRKVALTYAFVIRGETLKEFDRTFRGKIDDTQRCYVEHNFFSFLMNMKTSDMKRIYIQKYFTHIRSGSTGVVPSFLKTILRNVVYRF